LSPGVRQTTVSTWRLQTAPGAIPTAVALHVVPVGPPPHVRRPYPLVVEAKLHLLSSPFPIPSVVHELSSHAPSLPRVPLPPSTAPQAAPAVASCPVLLLRACVVLKPPRAKSPSEQRPRAPASYASSTTKGPLIANHLWSHPVPPPRPRALPRCSPTSPLPPSATPSTCRRRAPPNAARHHGRALPGEKSPSPNPQIRPPLRRGVPQPGSPPPRATGDRNRRPPPSEPPGSKAPLLQVASAAGPSQAGSLVGLGRATVEAAQMHSVISPFCFDLFKFIS
jgi:hypothetical protein